MTLPDPTAFVLGTSDPLGRALVAELEGRGARVSAHLPPDAATGDLGQALASVAPTHLFILEVQLELLRQALEVARELQPPPRVAYLSTPATREGERAVRDCGLPFTLARSSHRSAGPRSSLRASLLSVASTCARLLGARQFARRIRPTTEHELAYGLVHGAFNYTTIGRLLMPEELRFDQANHDQHHVPATRRDGRH